jgi:putative membrane protein
MIIQPRNESWGRRLFHFHGSALEEIRGRLTAVTLTAVVVTLHYSMELGQDLLDLHIAPFSLIGLALGIFLGFRNNAAYDRYWEGRKLWGSLVNTSRSFTRMSLNVITAPNTAHTEAEPEAVKRLQTELVHRTIAYAHALRLHLRQRTDDLSELEPLLGREEVEHIGRQLNVPAAILLPTSARLKEARKRGWLSDYHLPLLEEQLTSFTDIQGGCERIKNTPIPYAYTILIHRIVAVYCFGLPFGVVSTTLWATPIVVFLIGYAFFGLDAVGDEIEDPFGEEVNDLPLHQLSTMIEINLREALGEEEIPTPILPNEQNIVS